MCVRERESVCVCEREKERTHPVRGTTPARGERVSVTAVLRILFFKERGRAREGWSEIER